MTDKHTAEAAAAQASTVSAISRNGEHSETVFASGKYRVSCIGPREDRREEYIALKARWEQAVLFDEVALADALRAEMASMEEEKWTDEVQNLVVTQGKNDLLDKYLSGSAYTATWFLGLVDNAGFSAYAAGDTAASHAGWVESTAYSNANRPTPSFGAAASSSKASTATAFNINATATINGCFLISNNTKGGTTGILYSAGAFTGGNRSVTNGDTLNVTYTATA
jgi:hypothetical protein